MPQDSPNMVAQINVRLPGDVARAMVAECAKLGWSYGQYGRKAIEEKLARDAKAGAKKGGRWR